MDMKDILVELRDEKELKQTDIAKLLNVVSSTVSKYELGKSYPEHDGMVKLADYYHVNLDYLFGRTTIRTPIQDIEASLMAEGGMIPLDFIFRLTPEDKELLRRFLEALAKNPEYK